jgi:hypothetical protein
VFVMLAAPDRQTRSVLQRMYSPRRARRRPHVFAWSVGTLKGRNRP